MTQSGDNKVTHTFLYRTFPGDPCKITDRDGSEWVPLTKEERVVWAEEEAKRPPECQSDFIPTHKRLF